MPPYKYTRKDGSTWWYAAFYYIDWTGARKHAVKRGFKTQREAKEYERNFLEQKQPATDMLFSNLVEIYLKDMEHRLKPTTMEIKRNTFENRILPYFKNLKICNIDTVTIRLWQNELIAFRQPDGKPFSQTYLKTVNTQMSAVMNYAVKHYGLPSNPCLKAGGIGKSKADEMQIWTQEQYEEFSKTIKKTAVKLAFDVLFYTGMRMGELLALTPADILPTKRISITKNYAKVKGEELILVPKTEKSSRDISIPDFLYDDIQDYISRLYGIQPNDRIFYFTKSVLQKDIKTGAASAGLPEITVHSLRHSHASMLIHMGVNIAEISERLGHESIKTTLDTYAHLYPDTDTSLAISLNKLRQPKEGTDEQASDLSKEESNHDT